VHCYERELNDDKMAKLGTYSYKYPNETRDSATLEKDIELELLLILK
jgi:hypothetical protein